MSEHNLPPLVNMSISNRGGVTHDPLTPGLLTSHSDNTEDATSVSELDRINSKQPTARNTTAKAAHVTVEIVTAQLKGSLLSLTSLTPSGEKKKTGIFRQISLNLQYGTFHKDQLKVINYFGQDNFWSI